MLQHATKCRKCGEKAVFSGQTWKLGLNGFPMVRAECGECGDWIEDEMRPVNWVPEGCASTTEEEMI